MKIIECKQRSDEWYAARLGKVTASHFKDVLCDGAGRKDYMEKLVDERITGKRQPSFENAAMRWGVKTEPAARAYYEGATGLVVRQVGFVQLTDACGVSPDGFVSDEGFEVGNDGIIEIKCPNTSTHKKWAKANKLPPEHKAQVQGLLWACKRQWCDFVSFDPRVPTNPMWKIRVEQDDEYIEILLNALNKFIMETKELEDSVRAGQAHLTKAQQESMDYDADMEEEWRQAQEDRVRGMCRHGIVCAMIKSTAPDADWPAPSKYTKRFINDWVDFIMTGE
jgi:putative phage-type endonuclease